MSLLGVDIMGLTGQHKTSVFPWEAPFPLSWSTGLDGQYLQPSGVGVWPKIQAN